MLGDAAVNHCFVWKPRLSGIRQAICRSDSTERCIWLLSMFSRMVRAPGLQRREIAGGATPACRLSACRQGRQVLVARRPAPVGGEDVPTPTPSCARTEHTREWISMFCHRSKRPRARTDRASIRSCRAEPWVPKYTSGGLHNMTSTPHSDYSDLPVRGPCVHFSLSLFDSNRHIAEES